MTTYRVLGPATAVTSTISGRQYPGAPGNVYDVVDADADILCCNGWSRVAESGPSSARPTTNQSNGTNYFAAVGKQFFDTTIGKLIVFDGAAWRDPATGNSV